MSTFKCKMCGGALEIQNNETVIECTYCGTMQTLPKLDDDRKANLYDRANHFRRNNEFDKAMGIYEQILNEDQTDAETYWSLVLCRYGIEYVEDPTSHKRIPTVNRAQFTSILADEDYKSALKYADSYQRNLYEQEAKAIDEIQKGILAISQQEVPFDVFICYKETDAAGRRTPDSVLANDLYHQLTQEGFKVFFSRITLEDKLGQEYEPYIFAALNSAKVMVVLGTKPEYFNAVWVKNEWSRYLSLIKKGDKKTLIPAYKDMDPYDLPEEFSHLQAQDMSKLGFMQDLIRGIKKIVQTEAPKATIVKETVVTGGNVSIAPLLKRAFMFLEDGEWASADEYCEKVLDMDPECSEAYLGKLMVALKVRMQESLRDQAKPFDDNNNYKKAVRFADEILKTTLTGYTQHIKDRNENTRLENIYRSAISYMNKATSEARYIEAAREFESISNYKDSDMLAKECREKAETVRKDIILSKAKELLFNGNIYDIDKAIGLLRAIPNWKDADEQLCICQQKVEELQAKMESERVERERRVEFMQQNARVIGKRNKTIAIIAGLLILVIAVWITVIDPMIKRNAVIEKYGEAFVEEFETLKIGDTYLLGSYEQDNNIYNGQEAIEWTVLDIKDGKVLLLSEKALAFKPFNTSLESVTWDTCSLRQWLNNDFLQDAFSDIEQSIILTIKEANESYSESDSSTKIFLLKGAEVQKYLVEEKISCEPTTYAKTQTTVSISDGCKWWLRISGFSPTCAVKVNEDGFIDTKGTDVDSDSVAVRPALWLELKS